MTPSYKDLVAAHERAKRKIAADKAELKKISQALRRQQGQVQRTAHAAIGSAVLHGLREGWIKLDIEMLRKEAISLAPLKGLDTKEAIGDLLDEILGPAQPERIEPRPQPHVAEIPPSTNMARSAAVTASVVRTEGPKPAPSALTGAVTGRPGGRPASRAPMIGATLAPSGEKPGPRPIKP